MNNISATDSKGSGGVSAFATERGNPQDLRAITLALSSSFTILELLAASEGAATFLAQDKRAEPAGLDHLVKLKVVSEQALQDRKKLELFYLEARAAAKLSHKNIIKAGEPEQIDGFHFCAIDRTPSSDSLRRLLDLKAWLDVKLAVSITMQIAEALEYARGQGVLHLRLQPDCILINPEGSVLVTDFGIEDGEELRWARQERTQSLPALYCSPEQASGNDVDTRSDLYSLGIILYEMLTDRAPFSFQNHDGRMRKQRTQTPEPPDIFRADLPQPISALVMSLLEKEPLKRPQNPAHLQAILNGIIGGRGPVEISRAALRENQPAIAPDLLPEADEAPPIADEQSSPQPETAARATEARALAEPVLDIETDDALLSGPIVYEDQIDSLLNDEPAYIEPALPQPEELPGPPGWDNIAQTEDAPVFSPVAQEEIIPQVQSGVAPKREPFEPPTIDVIDPPAHDSGEHAPVTGNQASQQERLTQTEQNAPQGMRATLFLLLLLIIAAAAITLFGPANLLAVFRSRAPSNPPAELAVQDAQGPAQDLSVPASNDNAETSTPPISEKASSGEQSPPVSEKSAGGHPDETRTQDQEKDRMTSAASRPYRVKTAGRASPRKPKSFRAARPAKRVRGRAHHNY